MRGFARGNAFVWTAVMFGGVLGGMWWLGAAAVHLIGGVL